MRNSSIFPLKVALLFFLLLGGIKIYTTFLKKPDLTVVGYMHMDEGIGRLSVELIDTFKDDFSINFISTQKNDFLDIPEKVINIAKKKVSRLGKVVIFQDSLWRPGYNAYKKLKTPKNNAQIRIAYSMFESSALPEEWVTILNSYFDAVVVPDRFLIEVYKNSGVKLPIFVVPLGLNLQEFLNEPIKTKAYHPFVFSNLSICTDRKNQITLVRAFAKAFGNDEKVSLMINSRSGTSETYEKLKKEISNLGLTNIHFSNLSLDKKSYLVLFKTIDCYVNLSKGEGFSIQPREAMALGIPVIVTNNTAQRTLCDSSLVRAIPTSSQEPASYPWGATYGNFYLCDADRVAQELQEVYNNYPAYLSRSQAMRRFVEQYQYKNIKPYYKTLIKPKNVVLGEENKITPDCLTTNSKKLYRKYRKLL